MFRVFCPAKVNLFLHVTGQREDGYHTLDSLAVFASVGDTLLAVKAAQTQLEVISDGQPLAVSPDNTIFRVQQFLEDLTGERLPARFWLHKALPVAAGVGGGSADAAGALRALMHLYSIPLTTEQQQQVAVACGADVPACVLSRACRMQGIGEIVFPAPLALPLAAVLVNPRVPLLTADVFRLLSSRKEGQGEGRGWDVPARPLMPQRQEDFFYWLEETRNTLQEPAMTLCPVIQPVLQALQHTADCQLARLSGSGATCFGLYRSSEAAEVAAHRLRQQYPAWWVRACWLS